MGSQELTPVDPEPIISVQNLTKTYTISTNHGGFFGALRGLLKPSTREVVAVSDISFQVARGDAVGYIGPNGAGKSTTIKMLTGVLVPSSGSLCVDGLTPWRHRKQLAQKIGVVFGQRTQLWWDLPLIDSLDLVRYIYRIPPKQYRSSLAELREVLALDEILEIPVRQLSLGQRMRGDLAAAVLHEPPILYLDEPTIGLDMIAKSQVREFLSYINKERKVTILLTTHDLSDVAALCTRILVIDHGILLFSGDVSELRCRYGNHRILVVELDEAHSVESIDIPGTDYIKNEGQRYWLRFDRRNVQAADLIADAVARYPVQDVEIHEPTIEEFVRRMYQREGGEPERA